jgi:hypothetical protein
LATKAIDDFYAKEITAKGFPGQKYIDFIWASIKAYSK